MVLQQGEKVHLLPPDGEFVRTCFVSRRAADGKGFFRQAQTNLSAILYVLQKICGHSPRELIGAGVALAKRAAGEDALVALDIGPRWR